MKKLFSLIFLCLFLIPVLSSGEDLYEEQLNKGIRNSEPYAYVLIKQSKADTAHAKEILRKALRYSPDLPAVYFELSKASLSFSTDGIFEAVDYMLQGISAYQRNFWWSFTMVGSLYMSVIISFIISVIIIIFIRLSSDLRLLSHDIEEVRTKTLLLLVLAFALTGPIFLIGGLLFILGLYLKKWDRIVLFYGVDRRIKHWAYRCNRCGTILCNKCEKHILWGRMCMQCYRSLVKLDELDAKERVSRLLTVYEYQKQRRDMIKIISYILPGLAQIYAGDGFYGLLFLWTFLFFLCIPVMNSLFLTETFSFSHLWLNWGSFILLIGVYFLSNIITRRRLDKGWL